MIRVFCDEDDTDAQAGDFYVDCMGSWVYDAPGKIRGYNEMTEAEKAILKRLCAGVGTLYFVYFSDDPSNGKCGPTIVESSAKAVELARDRTSPGGYFPAKYAKFVTYSISGESQWMSNDAWEVK